MSREAHSPPAMLDTQQRCPKRGPAAYTLNRDVGGGEVPSEWCRSSCATGTWYVDWPGVCKEMGWDAAKLCGPVIMHTGLFAVREGNCCFFHPKGSSLHDPPMVNGKRFAMADFQERLQTKGLTVRKKELVAMSKKGGKPQGTPRQIGKALVYPTPHFG